MRIQMQDLLACCAAVSVVLAASLAPAQGVPRYVPQSPTISPYLNLVGNNRGALPNYYALVRPLERQAQLNQRAALELRRQAVEIERTQEEFNQQEITPTGKAAWFFNRGQRNQFRDTSHFFGQWPQSGQRATQRLGRR